MSVQDPIRFANWCSNSWFSRKDSLKGVWFCIEQGLNGREMLVTWEVRMVWIKNDEDIIMWSALEKSKMCPHYLVASGAKILSKGRDIFFQSSWYFFQGHEYAWKKVWDFCRHIKNNDDHDFEEDDQMHDFDAHFHTKFYLSLFISQ